MHAYMYCSLYVILMKGNPPTPAPSVHHPCLKAGGSPLPCTDTFSTVIDNILRSPTPLVHLVITVTDCHRLWTKMLHLFAPAGIPKAKITWKSICVHKIQKLVGAAGHTKRKF